MFLRLSRFIHIVPVAGDRVLVVDAISHVRLVVNRVVADVIMGFAGGKDVPSRAANEGLLAALIERGILTEKAATAELQHVANVLSPYHGRDPGELLDRFRRKAREGAHPSFAISTALTPEDLAAKGQRIELLLFGDCDVQIESDFLRREANRHGIDLKVAASFPDDLRLAIEHKHDAVLIGGLRVRYTIADSVDIPPHAFFIAEARKMLDSLRQRTSKPILIDNLPEPTVQPLGLAERGAGGHRNRFRATNIALAELAEAYSDVYVVDMAAVLGAAGSERLLDDGLVDFSHFGSPGWMLQRAEREKEAVHYLFPDPTPLAEWLGGDPYLREAVTARAHLDVIITTLGLERKKCVIVDLDGLLWPGVLAETGAPFAWSEDVSGPYSYVGLYFGLHEALLMLKKRGILLACVSKNDEAVVRALWKYEAHYGALRLLTPNDFVTWRVNWDNKVANIQSIAEELGLALETFVFIDDNPIERERVRRRLPEVEVWGEDIFSLRRRLLSDPRLQLPRITAESAARTDLTRAQISRQAARADSISEDDFLASLNVGISFEPLELGPNIARVAELFQRTTQFNTNGAKFSVAELEAVLRRPTARIFTAYVKDRFGDHGLVGAAVTEGDEITGLVLSCRVLGMGVEHKLLQYIITVLAPAHEYLFGRIIDTARNVPVRNLYHDNGFTQKDGVWRLELKDVALQS